MALQFCKYYLSYSMVLILLLLLRNHVNLILKLHQKKILAWWRVDFIGSLKVGSVPGMINKEVLANLYTNLHNQLKNWLSKKIWKNYNSLLYEYWRKRVGEKFIIEKFGLVGKIYKHAKFSFWFVFSGCHLSPYLE